MSFNPTETQSQFTFYCYSYILFWDLFLIDSRVLTKFCQVHKEGCPCVLESPRIDGRASANTLCWCLAKFLIVGKILHGDGWGKWVTRNKVFVQHSCNIGCPSFGTFGSGWASLIKIYWNLEILQNSKLPWAWPCCLILYLVPHDRLQSKWKYTKNIHKITLRLSL